MGTAPVCPALCRRLDARDMRHWRLILLLAAALGLGVAAELRQVSSGTFDRVVPLSGDPVAVTLDDATSRAFVVNGADYTVAIFDTASGKLLRSVPVGHGALGAAVDEPANRIFVPNAGDNSVSVLDAASGQPLRTTPLGFSPQLIAVDPRSGRVFLTSSGGDVLAILDGSTAMPLHTISLRRAPIAMAVDGATGCLFLANSDNTVEAVDGRTGHAVFDVAIGGYPAAIAVDERTGRLFAGDALNSLVVLLDARTGAVLGRIRLASNPLAMVVMSSMSRVFVAGVPAIPGGAGTARVTVLDARSGRLLADLPLGQSPLSMIGDEHHGTLLMDVGNAVLAMSVAGAARVRSYPVLGARYTPQGMAVDQRTGHLFVVNTDSSNGGSTASGLDVLSRWIPWLPSRSHVPYGSLNEIATAG